MIQPKPSPRPRRPATRIKRSGTAGSRTSKRRKARKAREKDCDHVFSLLIRTMGDWRCKACDTPFHLQCAHILSRAYRMIRFDTTNAVCLCRLHHRLWSYPNTVAWEDQVEVWYPGRLEVLKQKTRTLSWTKDYEGMLESLNAQLAALQARRAS